MINNKSEFNHKKKFREHKELSFQQGPTLIASSAASRAIYIIPNQYLSFSELWGVFI